MAATLAEPLPPVVLLGGLNLVRAAGLAGLRAVVATRDPREPALASRHCDEGVLLPPLEPPAAWIEALAELGSRLQDECGRRVPLFVGGDATLEAVLAHRTRLARHFLIPLPPPEVAGALLDKDRFRALAEARGLPVPDAIDGPDLARHEGPVVVKPRTKRDWHASALCRRLFGGDGKALVFDSGARAAADPLVAQHADELAFQSFIPGGDEALWSFHGYADGTGEVLAHFTGRKIRTFPVGMGESAFIELARDPTLEAAGLDCARRCGLRGFFKMDFKRDPRDGRWWLLEVNARCTLWNLLGAVNGLNLLRVAYDDLVHDASPASTAWRTDRRWHDLALDWRAFRQLHARGEMGFTRWAASVLFSRNVHNVFSLADPGPMLALLAARLRAKAARTTARARTALRQWRSTAS